MIESPALDEFKELVAKRAEAKGFTDATRQYTLDNLELRFGAVPSSVSTKLSEIKDTNRLRELHRLSVICPTIEAFVAGL